MSATRVMLTAGLAGAATIAFATSALATRTQSPTQTQTQAKTLTWPHTQNEALTIGGAKGHEHAAPSGNFAIAPGIPVHLTVTNYTREYHTISIPGMHFSALIFPARGKVPRNTTITFTASEYGAFAWYCAFCPQGTHGVRHTMGGTIYAIIEPTMLP